MFRSMSRLLKTCTILILGGLALNAHAQLKVQITKGGTSAIPVAIVPFGASFAASGDTNIAGIVGADLQSTGKINPISSLPAQPTSALELNPSQFRSAGANYVVLGTARQEGGNYVAEFSLVDTAQGSVLLQNRVTVASDRPRKMSHTIANLVYERLTGEKSAFGTRLAYVQQQGNAYALIVADSDGHSPSYVLNSNEPIMSPTWSPDGRKLAYVSYETGRPAIFVQDVFSGSRQQITSFPGINGSPSWSPDGSRIALTLSPNGNSEIYVYSLSSGGINRVTRNHAIDSEPSWSADGGSIYFTSDRGGEPAIYRIPAGGGNAVKVTGAGQSVDVSPKGDKIAYASGSGSSYRMVVASTSGGGAATIGNGPADETPSFSPYGNMLVYAVEQGGAGHLVIAATDGSMQQKLSSSNGSVKDPAWSPK